MLEFIALYLLTWPALVAILLVGVFFEHRAEHGWAVFTGIVAAVVAYFYFNVDLVDIALYSVAYLVAGVVWSFWRYRQFVRAGIGEIKSDASSETRRQQERDLMPNNNISKISAWILIWPLSLVENVTSDIIDTVETLIRTGLQRIYASIFKSIVGRDAE